MKTQYKPTVDELQSLGFENRGNDMWTSQIAENDFYGITLPQFLNYFSNKNKFLLGAAFYLYPENIDDLKTMLRILTRPTPAKANS